MNINNGNRKETKVDRINTFIPNLSNNVPNNNAAKASINIAKEKVYENY